MAAGAARNLSVPLDRGRRVVVPSKLFPKEEYAARTIRPKLRSYFQSSCIDRITKARYRWTERNQAAADHSIALAR